MGLESLVNKCLEPVEKLAQKVYGAMPGVVQKGLDYVKRGYVSVKETLHKYVNRPLDKYVGGTLEKYVCTPVKYVSGKVNKYALSPALDFFEKHPLLTTLLGAYLFFLI